MVVVVVAVSVYEVWVTVDVHAALTSGIPRLNLVDDVILAHETHVGIAPP
jgi:hypothetical protein